MVFTGLITMNLDPHPYENIHDLDAMRSLLQAGRQAQNGTYYVHPGDLNWWLFYPPLDQDHWGDLHLWDDPRQPGRLLAWAMVGADGGFFDVFIQPELHGTPQAEAMNAWAEQRLAEIARLAGKARIRRMWIAENDAWLGGWLEREGFRRTKPDVHMVCPLAAPLPAPSVPQGYTVRSSAGLDEVVARAAAQYGAFGSSAPVERYIERFSRFMRSPVYDPHWDVVAADPDGQIGAFCIAWPDLLNKVGLFEPVGTHPDFQRRGLGKAVMLEALRRLQAAGMVQAIVSTPADNLPAVKLYEAVGFETVQQLWMYEKVY